VTATLFVAVAITVIVLDLFISLGRTLVRLWRHRALR
jgi:hypothetical protein